jgi:hypothetical protein
MLKDSGYQEKFVMLKAWVPEIIEGVKKDLKNEHLKVDRVFCKRYFLGKNVAQIQSHEMAAAYETDIAEGNSGLGEFIATRWLLKNTDVYGFFEMHLKNLTSDFENLAELPEDLSRSLMEESSKQFGAKRTYLFAVLNSVVFPKHIYDVLHKAAVSETEKERQEEAKHEQVDVETLKKRHLRDMTALKERFEKKLSGLERKYLNDVEALKKQIGTLHRKLESLGSTR